MKLSDLGFDPWFEAHVDDMRQEDQGIARVSAVDRNSYIIRNETREIPAELAGKFYFHVESRLSCHVSAIGSPCSITMMTPCAIIHGAFHEGRFYAANVPA